MSIHVLDTICYVRVAYCSTTTVRSIVLCVIIYGVMNEGSRPKDSGLWEVCELRFVVLPTTSVCFTVFWRIPPSGRLAHINRRSYDAQGRHNVQQCSSPIARFSTNKRFVRRGVIPKCAELDYCAINAHVGRE